jgi:hypothetical protein
VSSRKPPARFGGRPDRNGAPDARARARDVLSREVGFVRKTHGGRLRVALAFPNTYWVGMSNLGLQTVYQLFNADDRVVCERVFLPGKQEIAALLAGREPLVTIESQALVREFDVFAFSVSFEWDYPNVVTMLRLAGLEPRADRRDPRDPLVVIGGAVTFVNPEPLALFADVIAAGEAELLAPDLVDAFAQDGSRDRQRLLNDLAGRRGFYVPSFYDVTYAGPGRVAAITPKPGTNAPAVVHKASVKVADRLEPPATTIFTPDTGVRIAPAHRGRARVRQSLPLLLGGLQLSARAAVQHRPHPRHRPCRPPARQSGGPGVDRALRPSRHRAHSRQPHRHGLQHQPRVVAAG